MLERLNPVSVARRALRTLRGWERLLATAPTNLRPILRQLQNGTIGVEFRIHDADGVTDRLVDGTRSGLYPRLSPVQASRRRRIN